MKLPVIKIQDNRSKKQFVFTNKSAHDYLYADKDGIQYSNLQNGEGTGSYKESGYSFVGEDGYMGVDIPMLDMLDILLLYYAERIKPLKTNIFDLEFDQIMGRFKALDMRVETKQKEKREEFNKQMMEYCEEYFKEN